MQFSQRSHGSVASFICNKMHKNMFPGRKFKKEVAERIRSRYTAPDDEKALRLLHLFCKDYREKAPDLAEWAETALPESLVVMKMPQSHRKKVRTVNMLERLNLTFYEPFSNTSEKIGKHGENNDNIR